jgi:hypothetical protein
VPNGEKSFCFPHLVYVSLIHSQRTQQDFDFFGIYMENVTEFHSAFLHSEIDLEIDFDQFLSRIIIGICPCIWFDLHRPVTIVYSALG